MIFLLFVNTDTKFAPFLFVVCNQLLTLHELEDVICFTVVAKRTWFRYREVSQYPSGSRNFSVPEHVLDENIDVVQVVVLQIEVLSAEGHSRSNGKAFKIDILVVLKRELLSVRQ